MRFLKNLFSKSIDFETDEGRRKMLKGLVATPIVVAAASSEPVVQKEFVDHQIQGQSHEYRGYHVVTTVASAYPSDWFTAIPPRYSKRMKV